MPIPPCVQCGYCCTKAPCTYGVWDFTRNQCAELLSNNLCAIYDKIKNYQVNPAMGAGCCSPMFNERREAKIKQLNAGGQNAEKQN